MMAGGGFEDGDLRATLSVALSVPDADDVPATLRDGVCETYVFGGPLGTGASMIVGLQRDSGLPVAVLRLAGSRRGREAALRDARWSQRVRHPNVVPVRDIVDRPDALAVFDWVEGASLGSLLPVAATCPVPVPAGVVGSILVDVLRALHAIHEARDERGAPLGLSCGGLSPASMLVCVDGVGRVCAGRARTHSEPAARRVDVDVLSAGVAGWGMLVVGAGQGDAREVTTPLDAVVARAVGLCGDPFASAALMADAIVATMPLADRREVAGWVRALGAGELRRVTALVTELRHTTYPTSWTMLHGEPAETAGGFRRSSPAWR